jgi:hypothetical protein
MHTIPSGAKMIAMIIRVFGYLKAVIAFLLRRSSDEKRRRIELYNRRIPVFNAIRDYMRLAASGDIQREAEQTLRQNTEHVSFLFGKDIRCFVDEIFDKSGKLHTLLAMQNHLSGKALAENLDKQTVITQWFMREAKSIDHRFEKYLNL